MATVVDEIALSSSDLLTGGAGAVVSPPIPAPAPPSTAKERFCLRVTRTFLKAVELLAQTEGLSKADIVRRSVGLYSHARIEEKAGRMIAFVKLGPDNAVTIEEIIAVSTPPGAVPTSSQPSPAGAAERFELRVTRTFLEAVEHLAQAEGLSKADIVRRSVGLYSHARIEEKAGRMIAFVKLGPDNAAKIEEIIRL